MAKKTKEAKSAPLMSKADIDAEAVGIVRGEKQRWEVSTAFVTDRVSFKMRELIRICRKNYYGIFDNPRDTVTNQEKIWYPLTEIHVENVVKNIDLDQKDIGFVSKDKEHSELTELTRAAVRERLSDMYFGEKLDQFTRNLAIDGTAVWKTYEEDGELRITPVDLLNVYLDPTSNSIQEAYRFTERTLMFPEEIMAMSGWSTEGMDKDIPTGVPRVDPSFMRNGGGATSNVKLWDVYETWGNIPKHLVTHDIRDKDIEIAGHIVVAGIDSPGNERVLLIEENTKKDKEGNALKPYEEAWYTRVPNRWHGRGVAEKLLTLQIYANIVFNVRINRSRISQLGLFKARKGAGITPQMLNSLPANGIVMLNNMQDLEQLVVQEVGASSYKDEEVINSITERLTNAFEIVTGEALPSSTPATNAVIQNQNAKSGFSLIKAGVASFLTRWMDRHGLPIIAKGLTAGSIVRFASSDDNFRELTEQLAVKMAMKELDSAFERGYVPSQEELDMEVQNAVEKLSRSDLFVTLVQRLVADGLYTEVVILNQEMNPLVTIQNLLTTLQLAPEYRESIVRQTFDLMGLPTPKAAALPQQPAPQGASLPNLPGVPGTNQMAGTFPTA